MLVAMTGFIYAWVGRFEDAIREAHKSFDIQKECPEGYFLLGDTYLIMGKEDEAIEAHRKLAEVDPVWKWALGYTYASTNHHDEAEIILSELENSQITSWKAFGMAAICGALGKNDEAFKWIAYEPHHAWIPWIAAAHWWEPLYDDPRYDDFVKRLILPGR